MGVEVDIRVNASELARQTGLAKSWISKLKKQGKLAFGSDGKISLAEARQQLEAAKDHRKDPQRAAAAKQRQPAPAGADPDVTGDVKEIYLEEHPQVPREDAPNVGKAIQKTILAKEIYNAKLRQIEYYEKIGSLIPVDDIRQAQERIAAAVRAHLLTLPSKMAPSLEGKPAPQIKVLLEREINQILGELSGMRGRRDN